MIKDVILNWIARWPVIAVGISITDTVTGIAGVLFWEVEESFSWSGVAGLGGRIRPEYAAGRFLNRNRR